MLRQACILGDPQRHARGVKSKVVLNIGEQNQKWLSPPCLLNGPKEGRNATSPLHSRGSPTPNAISKIKGAPQQRETKSEMAASPLPSREPKRGRKFYVTNALSGIPNAKCKKQNQKWSPTKENKIRSGCLTHAFSGAQKRAEMVRDPCILGDPQRQMQKAKSEVVPNKGEQNQKWLPHPCLLGCPIEGRNAMSPLHSRESPTASAASKTRSGPQQRGTKIKNGRLTRAFSGAQKRAEMLRTLTFSGSPEQGFKKGPH